MALPLISTFKSNLANGGGAARPNLFKVSIKNTPDTSLSVKLDEEILVKATSIPASTIAAAPLTYGGRPIKYAGFRTYANWSTTIINDEDFAIRNRIHEWMRQISGQLDGARTKTHGAYVNNKSYNEGVGTVTQINKDGENGESYTINNIWPTSIAEMAVDWSTDGFMEYAVEWCFDTWTHNAESV
jgi:hypothetical protein